MKYLKMLGLAAIAALALAAFAGATAASAAVLCKTAPSKAGVCEGGKYASGTTFEATSSSAVLTVVESATTTSVTCTHSVVKLKNTAESGSPGVPGEITGVSFSGCTTNSGVKCTVSETKGYTGSLTPTTDTGNGSLNVKGSAETEVNCGEFFTCKYKPTSSGLTLGFTGGNPATVTATSQSLEKISGFGFNCGTGAKWDATYKLVGANAALWVATA